MRLPVISTHHGLCVSLLAEDLSQEFRGQCPLSLCLWRRWSGHRESITATYHQKQQPRHCTGSHLDGSSRPACRHNLFLCAERGLWIFRRSLARSKPSSSQTQSSFVHSFCDAGSSFLFRALVRMGMDEHGRTHANVYARFS